MYSNLSSAAVFGISAFLVEIETHLDNGLPNFMIVGLPDSAVKESRERVTAAIKNSDFIFPAKKITINLAPADIRKEGSSFDLPIALGVLCAMGIIENDSLKDTLFLGELALDGSLRPIHGALAIAVEAKKNNIKRVLLPKQNAEEAALVDGLEVIPIETLAEANAFLNNEKRIDPLIVDINHYLKKIRKIMHLILQT
jgi:magnesium chelatase family protein